ncbi:MAG TPA: ATP-binding protein [Candidatus Dormibacteraeota bacterium]|nr:ATP-binding protein [Candidatus Dormibacteraeota bacterium]
MTTVQRRVIQAGVLALIVLACASEVSVSFYSDHITWELFGGAWYRPLLDILPGSAFILAGLIAWSRRPRNRVGLLLMGVGVGLLLGSPAFVWQLRNLVSPVVVSLVGAIVSSFWPVMLLHLLLAFPGGLLVSRLDRFVVRFFYAALPLSVLAAAAVFLEQPSLGFALSPLLGIVASAPEIVLVALVLVGAVLVGRRWILGRRARRRSTAPLLIAMAPYVGVWLVIAAGALQFWIWHVPSDALWLFIFSPLFLVAVPVGVLIGLLRSELDMASIGDLVIKLSGGLAPEQLKPALAQALHDPSLEVVYWLPDQEWFADLEGTRVELPGADSERAVSVVGDPVGPTAALVYDSSLVHEGQLVDTAAAAVRMALENARLQVQLRAQLEEVRQSRARLVEAADSERQRVERNLHDGAQQQLVTLLLSMQATKKEALRRSDRATAALIETNMVELKQALDELRELAHGIHPTILTQAGLMPAIRSLTDRCPIPVEVEGDVGDRLAPPLEATMYFVVAESITNAVKHSKGTHMGVHLRRRRGWATVDVSDDGVGGADMSLGSGLRGLSDRVAAVGGRLEVRTGRGSGTVVHAELPCE